MLPFLEAFYRNFYYPDKTAYSNEIDETDHMAKAVVVWFYNVDRKTVKWSFISNRLSLAIIKHDKYFLKGDQSYSVHIYGNTTQRSAFLEAKQGF